MIGEYEYLFCRKGHLAFSLNAVVSAKRCPECGEPFVIYCEHCNTKLAHTFSSPYGLPSRNPFQKPKRPDYCPECGTVFPWHEPKKQQSTDDFWERLHPSVVGVARKRFEDGHLADAVEATLKLLNQQVKVLVKQRANAEEDGASLMHKAFSPKNPIIVLDDLSTETGRNIQQGYMEIFAGTMTGIRNPKAHDIITIDETRAIHFLYLASLLFYKLDERR